MKNLIKRILKEGREHNVTIGGVDFYVDDFVSSQRNGETHIFLNVMGHSLPYNHYLAVSDELSSVGIESAPNQYSVDDDGEVEFVSVIRVKIDVLNIITMYLNTSMSNKGFFDKI